MSVNREMPKYECHKKVWALKIAGIVGDQHGGVYFQPAEEGYDKVPLTPEYVAKHKPEVGGYYVVYEDGYKSFSPAGAFESGYARIDGLAATLGRAAQPKGSTMRELNDHKINPGNDTLKITVLDEPGCGGANHAYDIEGGEAVPTHLRFQNGPINADGNGVNGITHEALLAVLCDRLRGFQAGPYACKANACALTHLEEAQHWLQQRTIERMRRGVEGTHTV